MGDQRYKGAKGPRCALQRMQIEKQHARVLELVDDNNNNKKKKNSWREKQPWGRWASQLWSCSAWMLHCSKNQVRSWCWRYFIYSRLSQFSQVSGPHLQFFRYFFSFLNFFSSWPSPCGKNFAGSIKSSCGGVSMFPLCMQGFLQALRLLHTEQNYKLNVKLSLDVSKSLTSWLFHLFLCGSVMKWWPDQGLPCLSPRTCASDFFHNGSLNDNNNNALLYN